MQSIISRTGLGGLAMLGGLLFAGACGRELVPPRQLDQYELLVPQDVRILPFTKAKSFDNDPAPDGVLVVLAASDALGDHVKAIGDYRFELFRFRPASGDPKGERLGFWEKSIRTVEDHRRHWDTFSQTYEFELLWDRTLPVNQRYVLQVCYVGPDGRRLFDEYEFDFRLPPGLRRMQSQAQVRGGA